MTLEDRREQAKDLFRQGYTEAEVARKVPLPARDIVLLKVSLSQQGLLPAREAPSAPQPPTQPATQPQPTQEVVVMPPRPSPTTMTSAGLRAILFAELASLREGKTSPKQALAAAKLADGICNTVKLELVHAERAAALGPDHAPAPLVLTGGAECSG
ncbi:hypothetical protein [Roseomonas indoligenes]|uniref:Uncharacterized protein n=1 Tax=Roseomonas indoligenes TaxID=2820811 RepID=A0A940S3F9_9PROT|nr:hypothetical protein [Pararoseomonas indoligenes]MBP0492191.1 hypothetical protein [Pararoseomonas indoligenes]